MRANRLLIVALVTLFAASGANCATFNNPFIGRPAPPPVLSATPSLDDVTAVVNANSARVRSLKATECRVTAGWMPGLTASIALERPRRFRLRAQTSLTGPELDLGSNDQVLWSWARLMEPPGVYYVRHDQFDQSIARQLIPIEPEWIPEAFGLATFSPQDQHQGPTPAGQGRLEIRTLRQTPLGPVTKITILDDRTGHVLEQQLYDRQGQMVLSVVSSQHELDAGSGAWLPRRIELKFAGFDTTLKLRLENVEINTIAADDAKLWAMPQLDGYPAVDLARFSMPQGAAGAGALSQQASGAMGPASYQQPAMLPPPPTQGSGGVNQYAAPSGGPTNPFETYAPPAGVPPTVNVPGASGPPAGVAGPSQVSSHYGSWPTGSMTQGADDGTWAQSHVTSPQVPAQPSSYGQPPAQVQPRQPVQPAGSSQQQPYQQSPRNFRPFRY